ncbi:phage scaffolding protein [Liquorilactobacillus nagelii]|uniref:phage scaffolding protein n=1 Tax=Liquorilactobacillus nagelii TaxID=82688 RepID=UPI001CCA84A6|nr:phage scaffolding protein [Liquorilactobacillus nagelii]ULQ49050.1 phage scaffolding protein [Liquorilactobacillus nagelii]
MAFTREFLKDLGIEGDNLEKIMAEYGKSHTESTDLQKKVADLTEQNGSLQSQIDDRDKQLTEIKRSAGDNEELKSKIKALQDANKQAAEDYQTKLAEQSKESKIELALRDVKAKNPKAVKALLDLNKVSVDGDNLIGFNEQIEKIKETDAYLFQPKDNNEPPKPPIKITGAGNPNNGDKPKAVADMSYSEMVEAAKQNPEMFKGII